MSAYGCLGLLGRHGVRRLQWLRLAGLLLLLLGCGVERDEERVDEPRSPQEAPPDPRNLDTRVFPAESLPFGKSYGEWSAEWWQWAFSTPASENPLFDATGEKCVTAQRGPVWFLAGVLGPSGVAVRQCAVPMHTALFFPFLIEWDNARVALPLTVRELRSFTSAFVGGVTDLVIEVDGIPLQNTQLLRVSSPTFSVTLPQDNVFQRLGNTLGTPGTYFPTVVEGFYVMLKPLPSGEHTLRMHSTSPASALDMTYRLTVVSLVLP